MELAKENQLELVVSNSATLLQDLLNSQNDLISSQIDELENIVFNQCKLTGVNPLSQEMAAGALSIKIGKRPRDLLNPKAIKYMQSIFSIKDVISKKEIREISALFGVTATQVREFFTSQRSRVRKFVRLSSEKANRSSSFQEVPGVAPLCHDPNDPLNPVPLDSMAPIKTEEGPPCSKQEEVPSAVDDSDKHFIDNIFSLMRKEETFTGQIKLMEWILQVQNSSILYWFLTKGGVMILATWLTQAVIEEQTSVLHIILKVLCHLPLQKALPVHMSAVLQSVNRLRFYRASDISNRARILLSRWSKTFARCQALKKTNGTKSASDALDEMLLKKSINEVMGDESWDSKVDTSDNATFLEDSSGNIRKLESQPLKLLTASADDSNKKLISGVRSSQNRERRKVLLVEQPVQRSAGRSSQVSRPTNATQGRPLSADDIQKAKLRAHFMQSKYGKTNATSDESPQLQPEVANKSISSQSSILLSAPKALDRHKIEEPKKSDAPPSKVPNQQNESVDNCLTMNLDEPPQKKCKRVPIPWQTPPEIGISFSWRVGTGENSKEVEVQKHRILRERETIYNTVHEIPSDPKEPWDREIDYDDTLTPEIPTEQLPDTEGLGVSISLSENEGTGGTSASSSAQNAGGSMPEPDLELLAVLLKNPELVFALTSSQAGNLPDEETVKLLDMMKANGMNSMGSLTALGGKGKAEDKVEVSLPSPTPSSDPVTNGWKPDYAKNPFSQQKLVVNHETAHVVHAVSLQEKLPTSNLVQQHILPKGAMAVEQSMAARQLAQQMVSAAAVHSQEKLPATNMVEPQHQIQPATIDVPQQAATAPQTVPPQFSLLQTSVGPHVQRLPTVTSTFRQNAPAYASNIQPTASELVLNSRNAFTSGLTLRTNQLGAAAPAVQVDTFGIVNPSAFPALGGSPARPVGFSMAPTQQLPPAQMQPPFPSEPPHSHSWRPRQGLDAISHYENNLHQSNYSAFGGAQVLSPVAPSSWERNDLADDPQFESWSPENSPVRSHGYNNTPGWNYPESRMNLGRSYNRSERPISRNPGYPSGYRDPGTSGNKRWTDRRR